MAGQLVVQMVEELVDLRVERSVTMLAAMRVDLWGRVLVVMSVEWSADALAWTTAGWKVVYSVDCLVDHWAESSVAQMADGKDDYSVACWAEQSVC